MNNLYKEMLEMNTEEISKKVDSFSSFQKAMIFGDSYRYRQEQDEKDKILALMYNNGSGYFVSGIIGHIAIIEAKSERDENPYSSAVNINGKWELTNVFWDNMEVALLQAIGHNHEGNNTRFPRYAANSLLIK